VTSTIAAAHCNRILSCAALISADMASVGGAGETGPEEAPADCSELTTEMKENLNKFVVPSPYHPEPPLRYGQDQ
jgi:hypothetical protein